MNRVVPLLLIPLLSTMALRSSATAAGPRPRAERSHPAPRPDKTGWLRHLQGLELGTVWYLSYGYGEQGGKEQNQASIGRGYVTVKYKHAKWFESRVTLDTHQDDSGDLKVRLKYMYAKLVLPIETAFLTEPNVELGLVHGPWFDYEEHIINYRMEGKMFTERNGLLNSADLGFTVGGLLGRKLGRAYRKQVSPKYPGKYGSFALGVYNGGGYHASEKNTNKVFMSRLSLRPLGFIVPNLQVSHFFVYGKGNTPKEICDPAGRCTPGDPDWMANTFMVSFEHRLFVVAAQLALGKGDQKGSKVDAAGKALDFFGYSAFLELKLPWILSAIIGRYDRFDWDTSGGDAPTSRIIAGYAFHFHGHSFLLLSIDRLTHGNSALPADWTVKATLQVKYP